MLAHGCLMSRIAAVILSLIALDLLAWSGRGTMAAVALARALARGAGWP